MQHWPVCSVALHEQKRTSENENYPQVLDYNHVFPRVETSQSREQDKGRCADQSAKLLHVGCAPSALSGPVPLACSGLAAFGPLPGTHSLYPWVISNMSTGGRLSIKLFSCFCRWTFKISLPSKVFPLSAFYYISKVFLYCCLPFLLSTVSTEGAEMVLLKSVALGLDPPT